MKRFLTLAMAVMFIVAIFMITSCKCEHVFSEWIEQEKATCTENGKEARTCIKCNKYTEERATLAKDHNFNNQVVNETYLKQEATCKQSAQYYYSCQCGEKGVNVFEMGIAYNHEYVYVSNGNGTHNKICKYDKMDIQTQNCIGAEPKCEMKAICEICNSEYGETKKHQFEESEVLKEASCTEEGKAFYICHCGEVEERKIEKLPHPYGEEIVVAPSCRHDGYMYQICTVCESETNHMNIIKAGAEYHDFSKVIYTIEVDCGKQQNGMRQAVCSVCGTVDPNGRTELIKWAHDYEEIRVEATCNTYGSISQVCKTCQAHGKVEVISKLPHTAVKESSIPATCTANGTDNYACSVCKETWTVKTYSALGHDWADEFSTQAPTCTLPGYQYYACTREECNGKRVMPGIVGDALGHDFSTELHYKEATETSDGYYYYPCTRCDEEYVA